jgi:spore germination cell wall hydrolase CwlJ-like protein
VQSLKEIDMEKYMRTLMIFVALLIPTVAVLAVLELKRGEMEYQAGVAGFARVADIDRELLCMTRNVYYEAGREPAQGKIAVAQVVMNRVAHPEFPDTPCEVIHQKTSRSKGVVCQFTWLCDGSVERNRIRQDLWLESEAAAKKVLLEGFRLPSLEHALFYHADYVSPNWRKVRVATIGRHIFYEHPRREKNV